MKLKRLLLVVLSLTAMLCMVLGIAACGEEEHEHSLKQTAAKEATCGAAGNSAYYTCSGCGKYFSDEKGETEIEKDSWVIAATGNHTPKEAYEKDKTNHWQVCKDCGTTIGEKAAHSGNPCTVCGHETQDTQEHEHTVADSKVWKSDGTSHWHECTGCDEKVDEAAHNGDPCTVCGYTTNVEEPPVEQHTHTLTAHEAKEPTCVAEGNTAYWSCSDCGKFFSDEAAETEITANSWVRSATGNHTPKETYDKDETNHWHACSVCGTETDEKVAHDGDPCETCGYTTHVHSLTPTLAKTATCVRAGNSAYYTCKICGNFFSDPQAKQQITEKSWILPATGEHTLKAGYEKDETSHWQKCSVCYTAVNKTEHTHSETYKTDGTNHWYECTVCKAELEKTAHKHSGTYTADTVYHYYVCTVCNAKLERATHNIKKVEEKDPTCVKAGNIEHYTCTGCNKLYSDTTAKVELTAEYVTISATNIHTPGNSLQTNATEHWFTCKVCGTEVAATAHTNDGYKTDGANHWYECLVCKKEYSKSAHEKADNYSYDGENHWYECTVCAVDFDKTAHKKGSYKTDDNYHWYECTACNTEFGLTLHTTDGYKTNNEQHWKYCSVCENEVAKADHDADSKHYPDGENHYQKCKVCEIEMNKENHVPSTLYWEYGSNHDGHWKPCMFCGAQATEVTQHSYDLEFDDDGHRFYDEDMICDQCSFNFFTPSQDLDFNGTQLIGRGTNKEKVIVIPTSNGNSGVFSIAPNAFQGDNILEEVVFLAPSINSLPVNVYSGAFANCPKLTKVTLKGTEKEWEDFMNRNLSAFPNNVDMFEYTEFEEEEVDGGDNAIYTACTDLSISGGGVQGRGACNHELVVIPNNVTYIGDLSSFTMKTLVIPRSVTRIYGEAMSMASNLKTIIYQGTQDEFEKNVTKGSDWCKKSVQIEYKPNITINNG